MKSVLICVLVVLQEDLDLVVHLVLNILATETSDDANDAKTQARQTRSPQANHITLLPRLACGRDYFVGYTLNFGQSSRAQWQSCKKAFDRRLWESCGCRSSWDDVGGRVALHVAENCLIDGDCD